MMTTTQTGIAMGKTVELGTVRIHRFADHFRVTDLTNAGRRGKRVAVATLAPTAHCRVKASAWLENMSKALVAMCASYDDVRRLATDILGTYPGELRFDAREERGVDVAPAGAQTLTVKTSGGLEIKASERDFYVCSTVYIGKAGIKQDTSYYPTGTKTEARAGSAAFFGWLRSNLSKVETMTIGDLRSEWDALGVRYTFH